MKKSTRSLKKILPTFLLLFGLSPVVWSSEYSIGRGWKDDQSLASNGFTEVASRVQGGRKLPTKMSTFEEIDNDGFDSVSTAEYGNVSARLIDDPDIDQYINIHSFLEITPNNYAELQGHAISFIKKGMFNRFDKGVLIQWKGAIGFDIKIFSPLLRSLQSIKKFKVSIDRDTSDTNFTKLIAKGVQGFEILEEIDLSGCGLTDESMEAIVESTASHQLVRLDIRRNRMTSAIISKIRKKFKKLEDLETDVTESESIQPLPSGIKSSSNTLKETALLENERLLAREREAIEKQRKEVEHLKLSEQKAATEMQRQRDIEKADQQRIQRAAEEKQRQIDEERKKLQQEAAALEEQKRTLEAEKQRRKAEQRQLTVVTRPMSMPIPAIARGYEEIYTRFLRGVLIYKPNKENDVGRIELPISDFLTRGQNPLESMFDLSRCGDAGRYLSISTGYRKGKVAANSSKYEVWIAPKFVVESEIGRTASHYRDIMSTWTAPFGLFYTCGGRDKLEWFNYLVTSSPEEISSKNLYEMTLRARPTEGTCAAHDRFPLSHMHWMTSRQHEFNFQF